MARVVLLRGVNVGGHRTFRPSVLAQELKRFDVVNIGAAGTFVVRAAVGQRQLRTEIERRLPFATNIMICNGSDFRRIAAADPFAAQHHGPDIVPFVSVLAKRQPGPAVPFDIPADGAWGVRVLEHRGRYVLGVYRRQMKAVRYLDQLEKLCGVPVTTRNWNTILAIVRTLK